MSQESIWMNFEVFAGLMEPRIPVGIGILAFLDFLGGGKVRRERAG